MKILLDPGHGGMAFGHYLTPGKRSPEVPPGIFEGEFNRMICEMVPEYMHKQDFLCIAPGPIQICLKDRINFVNKLAKKERVSLVSVHANAAPGSGWSDAQGFTVFHCRGASENSKRLAYLIHWHLQTRIGFWIDDRGIREANFAMVKKTSCPAVLVECGFMTNEHDSTFMASLEGRQAIVFAIAQACNDYCVEFEQ